MSRYRPRLSLSLPSSRLSLALQDPEVDANGQPRAVPLSLLEEARAQSSVRQQGALRAHMRQLRQRLAGVEDILRTVR